MDKYVQILKEHKLKVTPQRLEILKYLDTHRNHPTADMIYSKLKESYPSLSKTTVYNTLQHLGEHGLVHTLVISVYENRFDSVINPHHHFVCSRCGEILDIELECPYTKIDTLEGHRIQQVHGYFKGICRNCLGDEENPGEIEGGNK